MGVADLPAGSVEIVSVEFFARHESVWRLSRDGSGTLAFDHLNPELAKVGSYLIRN